MTTLAEGGSEGSHTGLPAFPSPFKHYDYGDGEPPKTLHETKLMAFEGAVCDKPGWFVKVGDDAIVARWRAEAPSLSDNEFEYCIRELRWRAERWGSGPSRPAAVEGVFAADDLLPAAQLSSLKTAVLRLEEIQGETIDWHPGSDQQVRDLVHPSLFCYRRGITPEVAPPKMSPVTLAQLTHSIGSGWPSAQSEQPEPEEEGVSRRHRPQDPMKSEDGLVWLPSEFAVSSAGSVTIESYINQLDPKQCPALYTAISDTFERLLPLLEDVLTVAACSHEENWRAKIAKRSPEQPGPDLHTVGGVSTRGYRAVIHIEGMELPHYMTRNQYPSSPLRYTSPVWVDKQKNEITDGGYYDDEFYYDSEAGEEIERTEENPGPPPPTLIEPSTPDASDYLPPEPAPERLQISLRGRKLQVITKLASIHLTPEKPRYEGGAWHVEGMIDDGIVATAICYFEQDNISESGLAFRAAVCEPDYAQGDTQGVDEIFGLGDGEALSQSRGLCTTTEGRCLAWPNALQHQVQPFELQDTSKPGHRKILCFFLVDPNKRVPSTLTCPPQQAVWLKRELVNMPLFFRLPKEVFSRLFDFVVAAPPAAENPYPPLATTEATDYEEWIVRVLGLEQKRAHQSKLEERTVGSLLTALFSGPDGARAQNVEAMIRAQNVWQLLQKLRQFEADRAIDGGQPDLAAQWPGRDIVAAAQQVAEALWLQGICAFQQADKRDTRSSLSKNNLVAPLLVQKDAEAIREILMAERGKIGRNWQGESFEREFSLCEH